MSFLKQTSNIVFTPILMLFTEGDGGILSQENKIQRLKVLGKHTF